MSYVEHGPRIFLAGRPNTGLPLLYGDYVLPRKRSEGRLKLHDSCSDVRAWSPNSLEKSRYFRELTEHASPTGKIIPFNVVLDNVIGLTAQAQNELYFVKKELQRYKRLQLTPEQKEQLLNLNTVCCNTRESLKGLSLTKTVQTSRSLLHNVFVNASKSLPTIHSNSYLSIHMPPNEDYQNGQKHRSLVVRGNNQSHNTDYRRFSIRDYSDKLTTCIECVDAALQVETETREIGVQFNGLLNKCISSKIVATSDMFEMSSVCKLSDEESTIVGRNKSSSHTNNRDVENFECDLSCSEDSRDIDTPSESDSEIDTESDFNLHDNSHKGIIIQKESLIIALENDLCVRDAELKELRDLNRTLEISLQEKQENLNILQNNLKIANDKLIRLEHHRNYEVDDLKKKVFACKTLMDQLKGELNKKCQTCYLQSEEIEKLRLFAKEAAALRTERDSLLKRLKEMESLAKEAEDCGLALKHLKDALLEKDQLKKENREQSCMLADQEDEINRLLLLIKQMGPTYNQQVKTEGILETLRAEIQDKDIKICHYEDQLLSMKHEISDFFDNLKHSLKNLQEFNESEEAFKCTRCEFDIGEEANNVLCNINVMLTRFHSYTIEREQLLQQIHDLKHLVQNSKVQTNSLHSQNLVNVASDQDLYYDTVTAEDSMILLNVRNNEDSTSEIEISNFSHSIGTETSYTEIVCNNCSKHGAKLNGGDNADTVEKEVIKHVSQSLAKMQCLMQKLQLYVENERPSLFKQIHNFYETLKDTESVITSSEDTAQKKQRISELYTQYKETYKRYKPDIKTLPNDLYKILIDLHKFIEVILYWQLDNISQLEKKSLHDGRINQAFEIHFKSCIDRINVAVQGATNERMQIVEDIEKQQQEIRTKNLEISRLKKEVAEHMQQRGMGDYTTQEELKKRAAVEEQLLKVTVELEKKDQCVLKLQEQLQLVESELSMYNKDCNMLKKQNKNLHNIQNTLMKECQKSKEELQSKNEEIIHLSQQLCDLLEMKNTVNTAKDKLKEMEQKVTNLQSENDGLRTKIIQLNDMILTKDERIDRNETLLSRKINEYSSLMEETRIELTKLREENDMLNEKLRNTEDKLAGTNATILSLTEENDKISVIYVLQDDLTKLDKNEKKLKVEINNLRTQLLNDQNTNKKLEHQLDMYLRENESLEKDVKYWKNENSQLSIKLHDEMKEQQSRKNLYSLPNKICEKLSTLKHQLNIENDLFNNESNRRGQDNLSVNKDYRSEGIELKFDNCKKQTKENEIEVSNKDSTDFNQFDIMQDNILKTTYKLRQLDNENKQMHDEVKNLLNDVQIRDSEIKNLKETINRLMQEKAELRLVLKSQVEEYQDKLMLMKKNYDSSLNALCARHKESVETLQKRFEDTITGEKPPFDSESWIQSLSAKELMELHQRVCVFGPCTIISTKSDLLINENPYFDQNNVENDELYRDSKEPDRNKFPNTRQNAYEKANKWVASRCKDQGPNKISSLNTTDENNLHVQNEWQLTVAKQDRKYLEPQLHDHKLNLKQNLEYSKQRYAEFKDKNEIEKQTVQSSSFDKQRWSFINQCSAYHKLGSTC